MWTCSKCGRIFKKTKQPHSCRKIPLAKHFKNKEHAKELYEYLLDQINDKAGPCKVISIPCCIHLFGKYDFIAILPKKYGLEIRFALDRKLKTERLKSSVPMSSKVFKNCFDIKNKEEIDNELLGYLKESYSLKG